MKRTITTKGGHVLELDERSDYALRVRRQLLESLTYPTLEHVFRAEPQALTADQKAALERDTHAIVDEAYPERAGEPFVRAIRKGKVAMNNDDIRKIEKHLETIEDGTGCSCCGGNPRAVHAAVETIRGILIEATKDHGSDHGHDDGAVTKTRQK